MTDAPHIQLRTSSRPENVGVVRELLEGLLSTSLRLRRELTDDVKTAVSEACNNVILHAYGGQEGPLDLDVTLQPGELELVVRDRGTGFQAQAERAADALHGVGLAVIRAYADRVALHGAPGQGTEVRLGFTLPEASLPDTFDAARPLTLREPSGAEVVVGLGSATLLEAVLARVTAAMAVRAHFTVDRLSDAQLVADTVAAQAAAAALGGQIVFAIASFSRELVMNIGPLRPGGGSALSATAPVGLEPVLGRLCDEVGVEPDTGSGGEHVRIRISDPR